MNDADLAYYRSRLRQEEEREAVSSHPDVAATHRKFADAYRTRLTEGKATTLFPFKAV